MDKIDSKNYRDFKKSFLNDSMTIPVFINNSEVNDVFCFDLGKEVLIILSPLIHIRILRPGVISSIHEDVESKFILMACQDIDIYVNYYRHINQLLKFYLNLSIDLEFYEVTQNIKNYIEYSEKQLK